MSSGIPHSVARIVASVALLVTAAAPTTAQQAGPSSEGPLRPAAVLTLQYQQSERPRIEDSEPLFGLYLGTGDGSATGDLQGTVGWDLYEDQSREDHHPALFRGFVDSGGERRPFQILGVFTPFGSETALAPDGREHPRHWTLSGTIVFADDTLLGARHAPLTGSIDLAVWRGTYTVWAGS